LGDASSNSEEDGGQRINVDNIRNTKKPDDDLWDFLQPVRVERVEHRDRAPQISSSVGADQNPKVEPDDKASESEAQEPEILGLVRNLRGAPEEEDNHGSALKTTTRKTREALELPPKPKRKRPETEPSVLWTDDDKTEWARREADDAALVEELSQVRIDDEGNASEEPADRLRDRVYILTFPPVLPGLLDASKPVKEEPPSPAADGPSDDDGDRDGGEDEEDVVEVKDEPAEAALFDGRGFPVRPGHLPELEPGRVGRLVVRRSGRATLDWGGTRLRVGLGLTPEVLQEVVSVTGREGGADEKGFGGEACSFGQVRGKFVVTPDWDELLGGAAED
jgi:DNA-directed RNA polymerase III subunit RPC4